MMLVHEPIAHWINETREKLRFNSLNVCCLNIPSKRQDEPFGRSCPANPEIFVTEYASSPNARAWKLKPGLAVFLVQMV